MQPYREHKLIGDEFLPIQVYDITMQKCCGSTIRDLSSLDDTTQKNNYDCARVLPHWHSYLEILYFTEGSASVQLNNQHFEVHSGDIVLIDSLDIHSMEGNYSHIVILIDTTQIPHMRTNFNKIFPESIHSKCITPKEQNISEAIIRDINSIICLYEEKPAGYYLKILSSIYAILGDIYFYSSQQQVNGISHNYSKKEDLKKLYIILDYINNNFKESISLEQAAAIVNFSPNYFCRFFKKNMGKTFFEYINYYRCSKAEMLINSTDKTMTEIALEVGFNSVSYFDKVYKKIKGYTPLKKL